MFKFIKQLNCKHKYENVGVWKCTYKYDDTDNVNSVPIYFFECPRCGKRKIIRDCDIFYRSNVLKITDLWVKGEIDLDFRDDDKIQVKRHDEDY